MAQRVLIRFAFDGARFRGTQRQPHGETVNDALLDALTAAGALPEEGPRLRAQGRKDSGASALDYPVALDVTTTLETAARAIAGQTVGIVPLAGAEVDEGFDPRLAARSRAYRYHVFDLAGIDLVTVEEAWSRFEGTHDVSAFARLVPRQREQDPVRTVTRTRTWVEDGALVLEVTGESFLRHQVRRMVGAALLAGRGELPIERIETALEGGELDPEATAPATGLTLWHVELPVETRALPEARRVAVDRLRRPRERIRQRERVLRDVVTRRSLP